MKGFLKWAAGFFGGAAFIFFGVTALLLLLKFLGELFGQ